MLSKYRKPALLAALLSVSASNAQAQITSLPAHPGLHAVAGAESFFDTDPGTGNGLPLSTGTGTDLSLTPAIPINALAKGAHRIFVRSRNTAGQWSHTHSQVVVIYSITQALPEIVNGTAVAAAEYFVDTDPGLGRGTPIPLPGPGMDVTASNIAIDISGLPLGIHRTFIRTQNASGQWSMSTGATFTILIKSITALPAHAAARPVTAMEYFIDTDPGYGNGTIMTVSPTADLANQNVAVDITGLATGTHTLFLRSVNGHSMTAAHTFSIGGTALPISWLDLGIRKDESAATIHWNIAQTPAQISYNIERSADGRRFERTGTVTANGGAGTATYEFRDEAPVPGQSFYRIRILNADGSTQFSPVLPFRNQDSEMEIRINNPVRNTLVIKRLGEGSAALELSIRSVSGQEVMRPGTSSSAVQSIDLSSLQTGMYLLCWMQNGQAQVQRFVKQ